MKRVLFVSILTTLQLVLLCAFLDILVKSLIMSGFSFGTPQTPQAVATNTVLPTFGTPQTT